MRYQIIPINNNSKEKVTLNFEHPPVAGECIRILLSDQKTVASWSVERIERIFTTNPSNNNQRIELEGVLHCKFLGIGEANHEHPILGPFVKK